MRMLLLDVLSKAIRITNKGEYKITFHHFGSTRTLRLYGFKADAPKEMIVSCWIELDQRDSAKRMKEALQLLSGLEGEEKIA